jgi:hypothetical protein
MIALAIALLRPVLRKSCGMQIEELFHDMKPARRTVWPASAQSRIRSHSRGSHAR